MLTIVICLLAIGLTGLGATGVLLLARRSLRRSYDQSVASVRSTAAEAEWKLQQLTRTAFEAMTEAARQSKAR